MAVTGAPPPFRATPRLLCSGWESVAVSRFGYRQRETPIDPGHGRNPTAFAAQARNCCRRGAFFPANRICPTALGGTSMRRTAVLTLAAALGAGVLSASAAQAETTALRSVMFVGNNWDGTATIVDAVTHEPLRTIDTIPDRDARMTEILTHPDKLAFYLAISQGVGEGHDQYTDDMFSTPDGRLVAVSRPSFADVVGIDLATDRIAWRFPMEGYRGDHMAVSPDGTRLLVSDSTANKVHELDIRTGAKLREFPSGDTPHESNYTKDGSRIFHASIGRVYTPSDPSQFCPLRDPTKGDQRFQIVDNSSFTILKQWDIGVKLEEAGYPCMSSAVRPMAISPDEKTAYL